MRSPLVIIQNLTKLPPHYEVNIRFRVYYIDNWDNYRFNVTINGAVAFTENYTMNSSLPNLCGHPNPEYTDYYQDIEIN